MNLHKFLSIYRAWFIYYLNTARIKVEPILVAMQALSELKPGSQVIAIGQY